MKQQENSIIKNLTSEVADESSFLQETINNFNKTEIQSSVKLKYSGGLLKYDAF